MLVVVFTKIIVASGTTSGFRKDDDDGGDSIDLLLATAVPPKQKRYISDDEGQAGLLENCNKASTKLLSLACLRKEPNAEAKKSSTAAMLPGGTSSAQEMVGPSSSAAEELVISCTTNEDFEDPTTHEAECFPGVSCLRPLTLALKGSLRGTRSSKKDKLVFHCGAALPDRAQTSSHARETCAADHGTKVGKRAQVAVVPFSKVSDTCTQEADRVSF